MSMFFLQEGHMDDASAVLDLHLGPSLPSDTCATATGAVFDSEIKFQAICMTEEAMLVCLRRMWIAKHKCFIRLIQLCA